MQVRADTVVRAQRIWRTLPLLSLLSLLSFLSLLFLFLLLAPPAYAVEQAMKVPSTLKVSEKNNMIEAGTITIRVPKNAITVVISDLLVEAPDGSAYKAKVGAFGIDILRGDTVREYVIPYSFEGLADKFKPGVYKVILKGYLDNEKHIEEQTFTVIDADKPQLQLPSLPSTGSSSGTGGTGTGTDGASIAIAVGAVAVGAVVAAVYGLKRLKRGKQPEPSPTSSTTT